ncbi:Linear gramicidin synthase subunit D [Termitomyces sp. T112]|nr:Linear gramicidin synthase subunit D [Termitomyces sp. T112]
MVPTDSSSVFQRLIFQTASSPTFAPPPLDGSLTIPEIYEYHLEYNGDHPLFLYDFNDEAVTVQWKQAVHAIRRAARIIHREVQPPPCMPNKTDKAPVIAILAVIDQLSYFALIAGIIRAGFTAFPISPRNSDVGINNLLQKTGAKYMFISRDSAMQGMAAAALEIPGVDGVQLLEIPTFDALYGVKVLEEPVFLPPVVKQNIDSTVMILHSSGSTSFPKPILISHRNLLQWGSQPYYGEMDLCGRILSNHALPFFHAMGVVSLSWATMAGLTLSNFAPSQPPVVSTPDRLFKSAIATKSKLILCVPSFLEEWSMDPSKVMALSEFDAVLFGGAPIQKIVGDDLVAKGVKLYPFYGATETGGTSKFLPKQPPAEGWEYFMLSPHVDPVFLEQQDKDDVFRLVFRKCGSHSPATTNTRISDVDSYDTNDLLIRHPANPNLWMIYGRSDDQIMHSTGEKTNPVPMETIINRHPCVANCLIFGRGRFQAGLLVEPVEPFETSDLEYLADFRNLIWPSVEEANRLAPSHSRIFKEMILVATPSKPFQYTPKGTPRRHVILDSYEEEIDTIYQAIEESSQTDIPIPTHFDEHTSLEFVRKAVENVLTSRLLSDDDDFFQNGCDSLQATWIRNTILHALRQLTKISVESIPINFVYLNPSIRRLGAYLAQISNPLTDNKSAFNDTGVTVSQMNELVDRYSVSFKQHQPSPSHVVDPCHDIVLLTGSTGGLGSYILEALVRDINVVRIYALNRPPTGGTNTREKQSAALENRSIDHSVLDSPKVVFIDGDTSHHNLDLSAVHYEELRTQVTCIIHNAWRVDFNVAISSMEPLIAGTRRLIDLALSSPRSKPPRFLFTSSIGVVRNWKDGPVPEAPILDAKFALGSGYPESKWVAERILTIAAEQTSLRPVIVRIGQMSGGRNGSWNPVEWVPSIIQSGKLVNCLPKASGFVSWIPVHSAAAALVEMRNSQERFLHLTHPRPVPWLTIFGPISRILGLPLVDYTVWLTSLKSLGSLDPRSAQFPPALRLLDFFQSADHPLPLAETEALGFPRLSMKSALSVAPSLGATNLPPLGEVDVKLWLQYWKPNAINKVTTPLVF